MIGGDLSVGRDQINVTGNMTQAQGDIVTGDKVVIFSDLSHQTFSKTNAVLLLLALSGFVGGMVGILRFYQYRLAVPALLGFLCIYLAIGFLFLRFWKRIRTNGQKEFYFSQFWRRVALIGLALSAPVALIFLLFFSYYLNSQPCLTEASKVPSDKFGILVADYTEGTFRFPSPQGLRLADDTLLAMQRRVIATSLANRVALGRVCWIWTDDSAIHAGKTAGASLILWGNAEGSAANSFEPRFTFAKEAVWPSDIDPILFGVNLNRVESSELPAKLSAQATSIAAFVLGLYYLRQGSTTDDYAHAVNELSFAIKQTELQAAALPKGTEQEDALRKTLAIFYVMRGRAHAALGDGEMAMQDYAVAEEHNDQYASIYVGRGNHYYAENNFERAEIEFRRALRLQENTPSANYGLANTLFYLNRADESIGYYHKAISQIENRAEDASGVHLVLGRVYLLGGQEASALAEFRHVLSSEKATLKQKQESQDGINEILTPSPTVISPTPFPTGTATLFPTATLLPTMSPSPTWTRVPSASLTPTLFPTRPQTRRPSPSPTPTAPTMTPTVMDTPTLFPTEKPEKPPTQFPTDPPEPTQFPTDAPEPTQFPTRAPTPVL